MHVRMSQMMNNFVNRKSDIEFFYATLIFESTWNFFNELTQESRQSKMQITLSKIIPYFLLFIFGWHMTIGPGALIFHRLKSFKILKNHVIPVSNFVGSQNEIMLSPAAIIKIPYMRPFFFAVSMPCFSLLYYFWTFFCNNQVPDPILFACALFPIYFTSVKMSTNYISFLVAFISLPITFSI